MAESTAAPVGALVVAVGGRHTVCAVAGDTQPVLARFPTVVGHVAHHGWPPAPNLKRIFVGDEIAPDGRTPNGLRLSLRYPVQRSNVVDPGCFERIHHYMRFGGPLQGVNEDCNWAEHPTLLCVPVGSGRSCPPQYGNRTTQMMFETFNVPVLYKVPEPVAALVGARLANNPGLLGASRAATSGLTTGMVIDLGATVTRVAPVLDGLVLEKAYVEIPFGGDDLDKRVWDLAAGVHDGGIFDLLDKRQSKLRLCRRAVRALKEKHARVASTAPSATTVETGAGEQKRADAATAASAPLQAAGLKWSERRARVEAAAARKAAQIDDFDHNAAIERVAAVTLAWGEREWERVAEGLFHPDQPYLTFDQGTGVYRPHRVNLAHVVPPPFETLAADGRRGSSGPETRVDPSAPHERYTKDEFVAYYKGTEEWEVAAASSSRPGGLSPLGLGALLQLSISRMLSACGAAATRRVLDTGVALVGGGSQCPGMARRVHREVCAAARVALGASHDHHACMWTALCCLRVDRRDATWDKLADKALAARHRARVRAGCVRRRVLERIVDFAFPRRVLQGGADAAVLGGAALMRLALRDNKGHGRLPFGLHAHYKGLALGHYNEVGPTLGDIAFEQAGGRSGGGSSLGRQPWFWEQWEVDGVPVFVNRATGVKTCTRPDHSAGHTVFWPKFPLVGAQDSDARGTFATSVVRKALEDLGYPTDSPPPDLTPSQYDGAQQKKKD